MATIKKAVRKSKKNVSISSNYLSTKSNQIAIPVPRFVPTSFGGIGRKVADASTGTGVGLQGWLDGTADISTFAPEIRNPTLNPEMFFFPKFISVDGTPNIELNSWLWHYLRWDALTANLTQLHCATKGTPVLTENGLKNIEDITYKDRVVGSKGVFQNIKWTEPILYDGKFITVRAIGTISTRWTGNHPFKIKKSERVRVGNKGFLWDRSEPVGEELWAKAEDLKVGDYLVYPKFKEEKYDENFTIDISQFVPLFKDRKTGRLNIFEVTDTTITNLIGVKNTCNRFIKINREFAELAGWYLAEGCGRKNVNFALNVNEITEGDRIIELLKSVFGVPDSNIQRIFSTDKKGHSRQEITIYSKPVTELFKALLGKGAFHKKIPDCLFFNTKEVVTTLIKSCIDGDGCVRKRDCLLTTVSKNLAFQIQVLGTKLDLFFKMRTVDQSKYHRCNGLQYILSISKEDYKSVFDRKLTYLKNAPQVSQTRQDENSFYLPITKLNEEYKIETVYDICTEDESFLSTSLVHNSTLPISRFGLVGVSDKHMLQFYEDNSDELNILDKIQMMLYEWFGIGETCPFARWDKEKGKFVEIKLLDPDYVNVTGHYMANTNHGEVPELYEWIPDEYLRQLIRTDNPFEQQYVNEHFDEEIRYAVENNYTLMLDPFNFTMIRRKLRDRDLRGTSMLMNILKVLQIEDKLREQHYAMAQQNINPIRHWKVGNDTFMADDNRMQGLETVIRQMQNDPQSNVITDHTVSLDIKGAVGSTDKMKDDYEWIENYKLTGLWANKAFVHSEGITYNSATIGMRVLMGRYLPIRAMFENYFYRKVFLPTALAQDFYTPMTQAQHGTNKTPAFIPSKKDRELVYPLFDWRHKQSLMDDQSVRSMLMQLRDKSQIAMKVICDTLDIDYNYNKTWLEKEMNSVFDADVMATRPTVLQSAGAGALKDSGTNIVTRIYDASVAFAKTLWGKSPNVQVEETPEAKKIKEEDEKDKPLGGALGEPSPDNTPEDVKKQQKYFETEYGQGQLAQYDKNMKLYLDSTKDMLKRAQTKSPYDYNYGGKDVAVKALRDNQYPTKVVETVRGQLYDARIILAQEGQRYVEGKSDIKEGIGSILAGINSNYHKRLYNLNKYLAQTTINTLGKADEPDDFILPDFEKRYALKIDAKDVDISDKNVRRAIWETIYPQLEYQIVSNFTNFVKLVELHAYSKLGIKNVYVNNVKTAISKVTEEQLGDMNSVIVPDTEMKIRKSFRFKKSAVKNCPVEMVPQVIRTIDKLGVAGEFDLVEMDTFSDNLYSENVLDSYLTSKFFKLDQNKLKDIYEKYYDLEKDEIEWWMKHAKLTVYGKQDNKELEEFVKENI